MVILRGRVLEGWAFKVRAPREAGDEYLSLVSIPAKEAANAVG